MKKRKLKKHHKILLMSTFGLLALSIPFFGIYSSHNASIPPSPCVGERPCPISRYPYPSLPVYPRQLTCGMCSSHTLCFSKSQKRAWCQNPQLGIANTADTTCVTCSPPTLTPSITPPHCYYQPICPTCTAGKPCPEIACAYKLICLSNTPPVMTR